MQLYIRDRVSSVTRPVKELKGFARVTLPRARRQTVTLDITPDRLAFWNLDMQFTVEPGEFDILVGQFVAQRSPANGRPLCRWLGSLAQFRK